MNEFPAFSAGDFAERVRQWRPNQDDLTGDHSLNPDITQLMQMAKMRDAAVLVPVVDRGSEATLLLTQRTDTLRKHSGKSPFRAVQSTRKMARRSGQLREANEEIGLAADRAEIIGNLPRYLTGSGFRSRPFLQW